MRLAKTVLGLTAVAAAIGGALPSQAAAPKTAALYFGNAAANGTGTCTPEYVLTAKPIGGAVCGTITAGAQGAGFLGSNDYNSDRKSVGYKLDGKRHVTGTVYVASYGPVAIGPAQTLPGPAGATVTITVNGTVIGETTVDTVSANVDGGAAIPINMALPSKLNGAVLKSVTATIDFRAGLYITTVRYDDAHASKLMVPRR